MNRGEVLKQIKDLIDETDFDEQIDSMMKASLNHAYTSELSRIDKRVSNTFIPVINKIATLPEDCISIVDCTPRLSAKDRRVGNAILTDKTGTLAVLYVTSREPLAEDADDLDLSPTLLNAAVYYCMSQYYDYKKRTEQSQWFLTKYKRMVDDFTNESDNTEEYVQHIDMRRGEE